MKLGKREARTDSRDLKFADYLDRTVLPSLPARWGHGFLYTDWLMLANDALGDCVIAGAEHETMLWNKVWGAKVDVPFSDQTAISDYSAITGYDPSDPNTDQGTDVRNALNYRRATGMVDANGARHKIYAYASLRAGDWQQLLEAVWLFGTVGIGFQFPASAMDQFNRGLAWDVVPNATIEGGHYVPICGFGNPGPGFCAAVTWGRRQPMSKAFYEAYNDESWAILSAETVGANGLGPHGFDLAQLTADLKEVSA